jgi:hypothetical protein
MVYVPWFYYECESSKVMTFCDKNILKILSTSIPVFIGCICTNVNVLLLIN